MKEKVKHKRLGRYIVHYIDITGQTLCGKDSTYMKEASYKDEVNCDKCKGG